MRTYLKIYTLAQNTAVRLEDVGYERVRLLPAKSYAAAGGMSLILGQGAADLTAIQNSGAAAGSDATFDLEGMFGLWAMNLNASAVLIVLGSGVQIDATGEPIDA
jgi:hypothetical protein